MENKKKTEEEFIEFLQEVEEYCYRNNIVSCPPSYYFTIRNKRYRVSNHRLSERKGKDKVKGAKGCYSIVTSMFNLIPIHKALLAGKQVDAMGNVLSDKVETMADYFSR